MKRVDEEHKKLQEVIGQLNERISLVLSKQEADFLAAYRAHMYNVQKELQALKARAVKAENELQKNDKIQKLEEECEWYRKEALRLDECNTAFKKDLIYMKEKLETLEDDRTFLARQLKASKKHNKLLRAELELVQEDKDTFDADQLSSARSDQDKRGSGLVLPDMRFTQSAPHSLTQQTNHLGRVRRDHGYNPQRPTTMPSKGSAANARYSRSVPAFNNTGNTEEYGEAEPEDVQALKSQVRALRKQLASERRQLARVRTGTVVEMKRSELQEFFVTCIEESRKAAERRRQKAMAANSKARPKTVSLRPQLALDSVSSPGNSLDDAAKPWLQPKVDLDDLTAFDRRAIMERLLLRDDVADLVYRHVFPDHLQSSSSALLAAKALTSGGVTNNPEMNSRLRKHSEMMYQMRNTIGGEGDLKRMHEDVGFEGGPETPLFEGNGEGNRVNLYPSTMKYLKGVN